MELIERSDLKKLIPISLFGICKVDGLSLETICSSYTYKQTGKNSGVFKLDKFLFHLQNKYSLSLEEYLLKYFDFQWPNCPTKGIPLGYKTQKDGILISRFSPGGVTRKDCPAFDAFCKRESEERRGENNPMYGKAAWNRGLTAETNDVLKKISEDRMGNVPSEETRRKMRDRRRDSLIKVRHNKPHTPETVEKLRLNTAKLWAEGRFNRVTSIHLKVREFLATQPLNTELVEEYQVKYFSMDFAFPERKIAVECQGTYFHVDPRIYPDGPRDKIQRRNFGRDKTKRKVCCDYEGWIIIELWETEINDGEFKNILLCKLKELNLLKE